MARKFISFLGTGNYKPCRYRLREQTSNDVCFIQEALVGFLCRKWTKEDSIFIFVTKEAKERHWEELSGALKRMNLQCAIKSIDIEDSKTEADIWNLFKNLYDAIDADDSIIFDLTHSFRYLPMLFFSILNYAQYLKHISVDGIYYGAFEARTTDDNVAPVFDLLDSYTVLQWANAADAFTNYGIADKLYRQIKKQDMDFSDSGKLSDSILDLARNMNCARGQRIYEGKMFSNCVEKINIYKHSADIKLNPILLPILDSVEHKITPFKNNSALNFVPAVQWYIDHDMPVEALSMLKEGIITYLLDYNGDDFKNPTLRLVLGQRLSFCERDKKFKYKPDQKEFEEQVESILSLGIAKKLKPIIERFNDFRNDIGHSGFLEQARNPGNLKKELNNAFKDVIEIFKEEEII